ncbi:MAG TPA: sodium:solute symporter [Phycisphaerae bacterium]|nr:sodium:solute symporter [Phycisphaerae bacterium]
MEHLSHLLDYVAGLEYFRYLNGVDYAVMTVYAAIVVGIGVYLKRRASRSLEHYFLAGRQLPWWALGVSGMLNFLDMTGTMLIVSFLYMLGPRGLYVEFRGGAVLILAFMMLWVGKWHYRSKCMTGAEWYVYRFGSDNMAKASRLIGAIGGIVPSIGMLAYLMQGAGTFLSMFLPFGPKTCAVLMVALTVAYTLMSGFYGVVYTDLFQSFIILVAVVIISVLAVTHVVGYDGDLGALAQEVTGNPDWMSSVPSWQTPIFKDYDSDYQFIFVLAVFYLFRNILGGLGAGADPRYFGARSERECGLLTFFWTWLMAFRWPLMMGFAAMGLFLVKGMFPNQEVLAQASQMVKRYVAEQAGARGPDALADKDLMKRLLPRERWEDKLSDISRHPEKYPPLADSLRGVLGDGWQSKLDMVSYEGQINPERILPAVILQYLPMGLRGLMLVSLVAAAMSTFSPTVNISTALFTRDIWQAFVRPKASNPELIAVSWMFGVLLTAGGFAMAYTSKNINDIWDWIIMGVTAGLAIPNLLRLYWWRFNAGGVVVGTFIAVVGAVAQRIIWPDMGPYLKFGLNTSVSFAGCIIGTFLTKPTDPRVVEHFYRTTRPFGFWGPLKKLLPPDMRTEMDRENRRDILSLPFALGWQVTLFLLPMQLIIGAFRDFAITLVVFLVCLGWLLVVWYRNLPADDSPLTKANPVFPPAS